MPADCNRGLQGYPHQFPGNVGTRAPPRPVRLYLSSRVAIYRKKAHDGRAYPEEVQPNSVVAPRECTDKEKVGHPYPVRKGWVEEWVGAEQENGGGSLNTKKTLQGKWGDR